MRLIIAGTRTFNDYALLQKSVDRIRVKRIEIISGHAMGADLLGERYASENQVPVKLFPADWNKHGLAAGPIRNAEMAEYATHCIVFWDGKSRGTASMIAEAKKAGIITTIIRF